MNVINPTLGTRTSLAITGFGSLANGNYVTSNAYVPNTNKPIDVIVEVEAATTNTPGGNKLLSVFLKETLDGTNYRSGPESGTTTTDERDLLPLGVVRMASSTTTHRATFSVAQALGYVPYGFKIVLKNDLNVTLTSGALYTSEVAGNIN